jgi:hypothetical protein
MLRTEAGYLVSCVRKKLSGLASAKDLYVSEWFRRARRYVEAKGGPWFILSAKHRAKHRLIAAYEINASAHRK